jgi:hypothetical protein
VRPRAQLAAVQLADRCRVDLRRVWPADGVTVTDDDVLDHLAGRTPDRVLLTAACELPEGTPVAEVRRVLGEYRAELAGRR